MQIRSATLVKTLENYRLLSLDVEKASGKAWSKLQTYLTVAPEVMFQELKMKNLDGNVTNTNLVKFAVESRDVLLYDMLHEAAVQNQCLAKFKDECSKQLPGFNYMPYYVQCNEVISLRDEVASLNQASDVSRQEIFECEQRERAATLKLVAMQCALPMHILWRLCSRDLPWSSHASFETPIAAFNAEKNLIRVCKLRSDINVSLTMLLNSNKSDEYKFPMVRGDNAIVTMHHNRFESKTVLQNDLIILGKVIKDSETQMFKRLSEAAITLLPSQIVKPMTFGVNTTFMLLVEMGSHTELRNKIRQFTLDDFAARDEQLRTPEMFARAEGQNGMARIIHEEMESRVKYAMQAGHTDFINEYTRIFWNNAEKMSVLSLQAGSNIGMQRK